MAFNNPTANPQNRNVPIHSEVIVPLGISTYIYFIKAHFKKENRGTCSSKI
jgi:hypothetical protein